MTVSEKERKKINTLEIIFSEGLSFAKSRDYLHGFPVILNLYGSDLKKCDCIFPNILQTHAHTHTLIPLDKDVNYD